MTTTQITTKVTGATYEARDVLKTAGFVFDGSQRCWFGTDEARAELGRITTPTYSRRNSKACRGLTVEAI